MKAPRTSLAKRVRARQHDIEKEVKKKVYLIDISWTSRPFDRLAKYSLRDLESAIDKREDEETIKEMFRKHEFLIEILRPYKDKVLDGVNPVYSDSYEQKYNQLKTRFLSV